MKLGIIGTAGRGEDGAKITEPVWRQMKIIAGKFIKERDIKHLVSGGAAVSDHIAVQAFNANFVERLTLYLPAKFDSIEEMFDVSSDPSATTANFWHQKFKFRLGIDSLSEINRAIHKGAEVIVEKGFLPRNKLVASNSDFLLAYTFGSGNKLADGGTNHCMKNFLLAKPKTVAFHVDLNDMQLHQGAEV